ncbi:MAG: hypothetical protein Q7S52_04180 [bacterium]|nr:hypothetical protein [bacterium]
MRAPQVFLALCFCAILSVPAVAAPTLPRGDFPDWYESWEKRVLTCQVKKGVKSELHTYTLRGVEGIISAVSVWYVNGDPFEAKYFEPAVDSTSLSGSRATGFALALDQNDKWQKLGTRGRLMTDVEMLQLRLLRLARLLRHGVTEEQFKKSWATCNRDRPGQLR